MKVNKNLKVRVKSGKVFALPKGTYAYCGSAMGGLKKRISRHFKKKKKLHWHIDFLTVSSQVEVLGAWIFEGKRIECDLAGIVSKFGRPVSGFGSSDCRCESHLFLIKFLPELKREIEKLKAPFLTEREVEKYGGVQTNFKQVG